MIRKRSGRALVLGLGASGRAASRLLHRQGWTVTALDEKAVWSPSLTAAGISDLASSLPDDRIKTFDVAVVSPGIPAGHAWLNQLAAFGVPVIPEFEFGCSAMTGPQVVAVTGSNGKSSVVKWIADTLGLAGKKAIPAGNYGKPVSEVALDQMHPDVLVLELSSFQLEQSVGFSPEMAVLLNLAPNHLDRHRTMENYTKAKARMFAFPSSGMKLLIHAPAWSLVQPYLPPTTKPLLFDASAQADYGVEGVSVFSRRSGLRVDLAETWWGRLPLLINAAAALGIFEQFQVPAEVVRRSAEQFVPLPHRLEFAGEKNGVRFINDSKCSTLTALAAALSSGASGNHLLAGGILKESDLEFLKELLAEKCVFVYCFGVAAQRMTEAWRDVVSCENCGDLKTAFSQAATRAVAGQTVLLSPGCSSFDQFSGYAQRGDVFKELVTAHIKADR